MNDTDLLLKIVNKAIDNGFDFCKWQYENTTIPLYGLMEGNIKQLFITNYYKLLLLDKGFAKYYFGFCSDDKCKGCYKNLILEKRLQQLILEDDLIAYYAKFLEENNEKSENSNKETNQ